MRRGLIVCALLALPVLGMSQQFLGAKEVLRRIIKEEDTTYTIPFIKFYKDSAALSPDEAGKRWVELALESSSEGGFYSALSGLPRPESWPAIAQALRADSEDPRLHLFGDLLGGTEQQQRQSLAELLADDPSEANIDLSILLAIRWKDGALAEKQMAELAKRQVMPESQEDRAEHMAKTVVLPDVIGVLGEERAKLAYLRFLKTADVRVAGDSLPVQYMLRTLARQQGGSFKRPQFEWVDDLASADIYPIFARAFPAVKSDARSAANARYLLREAVAGRLDAYTGDYTVLKKLSVSDDSGEDVNIIRQPEIAAKIWPHLHKAVSQGRPDNELLTVYWVVSVAANKIREAMPILKPFEANPNYRAAEMMRDGYGYLDDVEAVIAATRASAKAGPAGIYNLAQMGRLLKRPELVEEAIALARKRSPMVTAELLLDENRLVEAEQEILRIAENDDYSSDYTTGAMLVRIYFAAKRYQDVIDVLPLFSESGFVDVGDLISSEENEDKFSLAVAQSFMETGQRDVALKMVWRYIDTNPGVDAGYQLLLKLIKPEEAMAFFDKAAAANPFEERPLIWKAKLLLDAKQLDEAEKAARKAVEIDPSDGETGKGDRMRVYSVLADILQAKGDAAQAEVYRNAVRAIRMSEDADDYSSLSLHRRAENLYKESLNVFADAYCIQSRLAVNLANAGRYAEAAEHFRKAFELMPDSFGRVESHCFGCEGVFTVGPASGIAESVLTEIVKSRPDKPQAHYLLGYLREEQGRDAEAVPYLLKAVELDPDYLNAWAKLFDLNDLLTKADQQRVRENLIRLDPARTEGYRYSSPALDANFADIYRDAVRFRVETPVEVPKPIFPIGTPEQQRENQRYNTVFGSNYGPGYELVSHPIIAALATGPEGDYARGMPH